MGIPVNSVFPFTEITTLVPVGTVSNKYQPGNRERVVRNRQSLPPNCRKTLQIPETVVGPRSDKISDFDGATLLEIRVDLNADNIIGVASHLLK
jgi:hypothetical protein